MRNSKVGIVKMLNRKAFLVSIALIFQLLHISCSGQSIESEVDEYINAWLKMERFSGSILIANDGNILIKKGYGIGIIATMLNRQDCLKSCSCER